MFCHLCLIDERIIGKWATLNALSFSECCTDFFFVIFLCFVTKFLSKLSFSSVDLYFFTYIVHLVKNFLHN